MPDYMMPYIIIPVLIFAARIIDVSMGTIRIIFVARGIRLLASIFGFFEVLIWLIAINQIMSHYNNWVTYIAYAAGFATGNYVGITIERYLSMGTVMIRIVTLREATDLVQLLSAQGYGLTSIDAHGVMGPVKVIFTVVRRKNIKNVTESINRLHPNAFYTVEDVRHVSDRNPLPLCDSHTWLDRINTHFLKRK